MNDRKKIQNYINNFRRKIAAYLRPGIGLSCNVHPTETDGAILEFIIGDELQNDDSYKNVTPTINDALSTIEQRAFGGNLDGFKFSGTNLIMEENRIIFIKDDSSSEWTDIAAQNDVLKLLPKTERSK